MSRYSPGTPAMDHAQKPQRLALRASDRGGGRAGDSGWVCLRYQAGHFPALGAAGMEEGQQLGTSFFVMVISSPTHPCSPSKATLSFCVFWGAVLWKCTRLRSLLLTERKAHTPVRIKQLVLRLLRNCRLEATAYSDSRLIVVAAVTGAETVHQLLLGAQRALAFLLVESNSEVEGHSGGLRGVL